MNKEHDADCCLNKITAQLDMMLSRDITRSSILVEPPKKNIFVFDPTGKDPNNKIEKEIHKIDSSNIIRPLTGLFYGSSLSIHIDNIELKYREDYILGLSSFDNITRALSVNGIYDFILLTKEYNGDACISYQTVGDICEKTLDDINNILNKQSSTPGNSIGDAILNIKKQCCYYNSIPSIFNIKNKDEGFQWITIGEFGNSTSLIGNFGLDIISEHYGWGYNLHIAVNLNSDKKITIAIINETPRNEVFIDGDYDTLINIHNSLLKFRLLWNDKPEFSGALIQLGYYMKANATDKLFIHSSSCTNKFRIYDTNDTVYASGISAFVLPNDEIWSIDNIHSKITNYNICPKEGYTAWVGEYPISVISRSSKDLKLNILRGIIDLSSINKIQFLIYDRLERRLFKVENEHNGTSEYTSGAILFYKEDLCVLHYLLYIINNDIVLNIKAILGTHSFTNDRFDLRRIIFMV